MNVSHTAQSPATLNDALWASYRATGDAAARAQLLDRHLGLVHHVAREVSKRTPQVELDELVSAGTLGLIRAMESFDHSRGLAFSTYAVRRIRGAILDDLRSRDWTPRSVRMKGRKIAEATARLQASLGREPEPRELAAALDIDLETYWDWRSAVTGGAMVSFDGWSDPGSRNPLALEETLENPDAPALDLDLTQEETVRELKAVLAELSEKERTVLALYYYEELNLKQIAEILHVTQSRISQIRTKALGRLRMRLLDAQEAR
jgi:RNA polymerase sigma factor for flagellar operon FliA